MTTAREAFEELVKEDPRFIEAPKTNQVVVIIGGRPTAGPAVAQDDARSE